MICIRKKSKSIKTFVLSVDNRRKPMYNQDMNNLLLQVVGQVSTTGGFLSLLLTVVIMCFIFYVPYRIIKKILEIFEKWLDKK